MLPPPAMDDVDVKSDNIVDFQNDDEDGFGAFNALSSDLAASAVEIPSMPMSMPPPPTMDDVGLKSDNIVDAVINDDEDGFGAFNALSSGTAEATIATAEIPSIPSMPMSMPPPPAVDDVGLKSDKIVDAVINDDEDGFGAFNALSSSSAAPLPGAAEIPSMHASILPSAVFSPTINEVNTNHSTQDDSFGAFDSVSRTAETLLVPSQTNNLPSQFNFNSGNMINTLETEKNMHPESNNFDSDDDFGDFSCSQDVTSSQKIDPFLGFDRSVQMTSNTYASNSHTQSETKNSNAVTNGDDDDDFGDFSSAGMNMSSGSTNAITDAFSIFD
ncbi:predicted protein [Chaetoceros tenuissimus]|uniref:Uncharacterized protein n=1 Tax=Chaetoceros tenuissimus TaxID=426638 RepID=A0AAD3H6Y1_9STRA|nr:predicted protein [Chaetoceros tenuissimus]